MDLPTYGANASHHDHIMSLAPRPGSEIVVAALERDCDPSIVEELAELIRQFSAYRRGVRSTKPPKSANERIEEIFGDLDTLGTQERIIVERKQVRYLSAAITAAAWLEWFQPEDRKT